MSDVWVKVKLDPDLHNKFRRWVFENDTSMQKAVVGWIEQHCDESKASPVKRQRANEESQVVGGGLVSPVATKPVPATPAVQAKPVSEFLCKACGKPTKGEFLCPTCKKAKECAK